MMTKPPGSAPYLRLGIRIYNVEDPLLYRLLVEQKATDRTLYLKRLLRAGLLAEQGRALSPQPAVDERPAAAPAAVMLGDRLEVGLGGVDLDGNFDPSSF